MKQGNLSKGSTRSVYFKLAVGAAAWLGLTWLVFAGFIVNTPLTLLSVQAGAIAHARDMALFSSVLALLPMAGGLYKLGGARDPAFVMALIWSMGAISLAFSIFMLTKPLLDSAL